MTDLELAQMCADVYDHATVDIAKDLAALVVVRDDETIVSFRGTENREGWKRDVDARITRHPDFGPCHRGILSGAAKLRVELDKLIDNSKALKLVGHSLGGGLAIHYGALRIVGGERVDELMTCGAPKVGYDHLVKIWSVLPPNMRRQYRNGNDPIPDQPRIDRAYRHVSELTPIGFSEPIEYWTCHYMQRYLLALKEMES